MNREDIIKGLAPISMNTKKIPSIEECFLALEEAPGFHSESLSHTMALIHLRSHVSALQKLLATSIAALDDCVYVIRDGGDPEVYIEDIEATCDYLRSYNV